MQPRVAVLGVLRFPAERMDEVRPHLATFVDATRRHDGCIAYDVAEDMADPGLIRFTELWPDHESLQKHLAAPHIGPWRAVAQRCGVIERSFTAYDISGASAM
ncbi:MAG: putative quinol monooxygenase [Gemmatimonadales bacterium]